MTDAEIEKALAELIIEAAKDPTHEIHDVAVRILSGCRVEITPGWQSYNPHRSGDR